MMPALPGPAKCRNGSGALSTWVALRRVVHRLPRLSRGHSLPISMPWGAGFSKPPPNRDHAAGVTVVESGLHVQRGQPVLPYKIRLSLEGPPGRLFPLWPRSGIKPRGADAPASHELAVHNVQLVKELRALQVLRGVDDEGVDHVDEAVSTRHSAHLR